MSDPLKSGPTKLAKISKLSLVSENETIILYVVKTYINSAEHSGTLASDNNKWFVF